MSADASLADEQIVDVEVPALLPDAEYDVEVPLAEREKKWGFTLDELRGASKVVRTLFLDPSLFIGDPYLSDSRLYTMITRDRQRKRQHREVYKAIMNEEKSRRRKYLRKQNRAALDLTIMKREREEALGALLLDAAPSGSAGPLLLVKSGPEQAEIVATATATSGEAAAKSSTAAATVSADAGAECDAFTQAEKAHLRLIGAFENILRLERCLEGREHFETSYDASKKATEGSAEGSGLRLVTGAIGDPRCPATTGGNYGDGVNDSAPRVDWAAASQLTAQVYRYLSHPFGSQMPPPLFAGPIPVTARAEERCTYIRGLKLHLAAEAAALRPAAGGGGGHADGQTKRARTEGAVGAADAGGEGKSVLSLRSGGPSGMESVVCVPSCETGGADARRTWSAFTSVQALRWLVARGSKESITDEDEEEENEPREASWRGGGGAEAETLAAATVTMFLPGTRLLRILETVLGGDEEAKTAAAAEVFASPGADATASAECTLNLFLARRLYASGRIRAIGTSPIVVERQPPTSESEEPDAYSAFDDVQLYASAHHDGDGLRLNGWRGCNICKVRFNRLHPYYYSMCHLCGEFNYNKRLMTRDLRGKVVLLTGCRIKIGYAMTLSLLRCGATVLGTTRFVHEAAARFQQESDYAVWRHRLHLYALDMRDLWIVTQFCAFVKRHFPKLFAIMNNAAQTIARTPQYTEHLRRIELNPAPVLRCTIAQDSTANEWHNFFLHHTTVTVGQALSIEHPPSSQPFLPIMERSDNCNVSADNSGSGGSEVAVVGDDDDEANMTATGATKAGGAAPPAKIDVCAPSTSTSAATATVTTTVSTPSALPSGIVSHTGDEAATTLVFDRYDTQAEESDHRESNSWVMRLSEVQGSEAAEVMAINALAPFIMNGKLKPCLANRSGDATPNEPRFIINVSAMEGQFYRFKQTTHPHTNMAKAALNMMTRTSAADYAEDGIYMNSVDTGWITDESPKMKKERRSEQYMLCPLDEVDAAARCLDLIYIDSPVHGHFYKDFKSIPW